VDPGLGTERFRQVAGRFATGVTVVTTVGEGAVRGMTVNAFTSVSLDPLLVLVAVDRQASMHELIQRHGVFAVTVLSAGQEALSRYFASPGRAEGAAQFADVPCEAAPVTGSPVIQGGLGWLDCRVAAAHTAGDHSLFVGEVVAMGGPFPGDPLVFFGGGYHALGTGRGTAPEPLEPG
jgi:flavin reductase (DIM6/NTAB) family NADH-FMN oxidoreductase RutF